MKGKHWTDVIANEIRKIKDFSCCVKFIRHFVPRKDNYLFSFDFGCTIEDCKMKGKGVLQNNFELKIEFVENKVSHKKKENNSYNARHLRKKERTHLGKELENVVYPSKKIHSYLAADKKINMETGCLSIKSKNVFCQAKYEWYKKNYRMKIYSRVWKSLRRTTKTNRRANKLKATYRCKINFHF